MERPAPKPGHMRPDLSDIPEQVEAEPETPTRGSSPPVALGWRFALLLWVTAVGFLVAFELVSTLFKLLKVRP
jgi:hypothetical protein